MSKPAPSFCEFGPFRLDPVRRLLLRGGEVVPLPPKAFETLFALLENSDRVVEKSELMTAIWPDSFVEESNLTQNVSILRKALGERAGEHNYIVTVPGRGYRFVASVRCVCDEETPVEVPIHQPNLEGNAVWQQEQQTSIKPEGRFSADTRHFAASVEQGGSLVLEKRTITKMVAEQEEDTFAESEVEAGQRAAQKTFPAGIWAKPSRRLNRMLLILCALALGGLVVAGSYFLASRKSNPPDSILEVKSIAVLPFNALGEDSQNEYLSARDWPMR